MIKAVLFDLYNTLAYIDPRDYQAAKRKMAEAAKVPAPLFHYLWRQYSPVSNRGEMTSVQERIARVLRDFGMEAPTSRLDEIAAIEWNLQENQVRLGSDSLGILSQLKGMGLKLALVSNTGCTSCRVPDLLGIAPFLDTVVFSYVTKCGKPGAAIYQVACDNLGVLPEQCVFVGDGDDMELEGAFSLGMFTVHLDEQGSVPGRPQISQQHHSKISRLADLVEVVRLLLVESSSLGLRPEA